MEISDAVLFNQYKDSKSVKSKIKLLESLFRNAKIRKCVASRLIDKIVPLIIPAGTKAKIKGDSFNSLITRDIHNIVKRMRRKTLKVEIEKPNVLVHEIPDWSIYDSKTGKRMIGYNQMDLWMGGAQVNRASKYVLDDCFHRRLLNKNARLCCVVYKKFPEIHKCGKFCKKRRIISYGRSKQRIIHRDQLDSIIKSFFC